MCDAFLFFLMLKPISSHDCQQLSHTEVWELGLNAKVALITSLSCLESKAENCHCCSKGSSMTFEDYSH